MILEDLLKYKKVNLHFMFPIRIGHLAMNTELFIRRQSIKPQTDEEIDLLINKFPPKKVASEQLYKMIKRKYTVIDNPADIKNLLWLANELPDNFVDNKAITSRTNEFWEFNNISPQLSFTEEEELQGKKLLEDMGIGDVPFVCFHSRDSLYMKQWIPEHDYSHNDYRDCSIENYLEACDYLTKQGIYCLRMGAVVGKPLKTNNPMIIDYATKYRTDFGDIYLPAHCKFFLGNTAGLYLVSTIFGVPNASANHVPFGWTPLLKEDIFIPKLYKQFGEYVPFQELMFIPIEVWEEYVPLEAIENSSDEIYELAKEMNTSINGVYEVDMEEIYLQTIFKSMYHPQMRCYGTPARISNYFLNKYRKLL